MFFKCKHPAKYLSVQKNETKKLSDDGYFLEITYHLRCICGEKIDIKHSELTDKYWSFRCKPDTIA
jgi:hypothetical protein